MGRIRIGMTDEEFHKMRIGNPTIKGRDWYFDEIRDPDFPKGNSKWCIHREMLRRQREQGWA